MCARHHRHRLPTRIPADADDNRPLRAQTCQIADQRIAAPVRQAKINQHHIGAVNPQMTVSRLQCIHPPQPRA